MTNSSVQTATDYLRAEGFLVKSIDDPQLWTHLEQTILDSHALGGKFAPTTSSRVLEMMTAADHAALIAMAEQHRHAGSLEMVEQIVTMPFVIGTEGIVPLDSVAENVRLSVVVRPGEQDEQMVTIVTVSDDAVPSTKQMTIKCGLYADGRTLGVRGIHSGGQTTRRFGGQGAYLTTRRDVHAMMAAMADHLDDIAVVTRAEGEAMLQRLRDVLGA